MSTSGGREVAHRLFAAEYDDASLEYAESDEERAPNYVVTPTGARVNRVFVVGVLTSVEQVNEDTVRARIADPTGAFVVYAGQYQPDEHAALQSIEAPAFVAVTGKANTFTPDGSDRVLTSVRPESVTEVDAETRDRWVVTAAEHALARIETAAGALDREERGDDLAAALVREGIDPGLAEGTARAIDHYGTTPDYLAAMRDLAIQAVEVVAGERDEAGELDLAPDESDGRAAVGDLVDSAPAGATTVTEAAGDVEPPTPDGADEETGDEAAEPDATSDESETVATAASDQDTDPADEPDEEPDEADASDETSASEPADDGTADAATEAVGSEPEAGAEQPDDAVVADADLDADDGELYEVDEEERERIEEEYGVGFESGAEVDEPGQAGIETPDPDATDDGAEESEAATTGDEGTEPADGTGVDAEADEPDRDEYSTDEGTVAESDDDGQDAESGADRASTDEPNADETGEDAADADGEDVGDADVDLEDAVMEEMRARDGDDGADREALIAAVAEETGADEDAVDEAIDDALMAGKCYEPSDGTVKPI